MTYIELVKAIKCILPHASIEQDNYGQLIIYTDLMEVEDEDELVEFVSHDDE